MKRTLTVNRIATSAVALVCAGFVGMSYAAGQTAKLADLSGPRQVIDLTRGDFPEPPDDNAAEKGREVTKVVQELVREVRRDEQLGRLGNDGSITFPGVF